jgi:putative ABC transport system permease protein
MITGLARRLTADSVIAVNILGEAGASLHGRRMQAALSAFGIATGITAVVLLVSIVSGVHRYLLETLGAIGGNLIQVNTSSQRSTRDPRGFAVTLRVSDLGALIESSPYFDAGMAENSAYAPLRSVRRSARETYIRGITSQGLDVLGLHVAHGRALLASEYDTGARVAVLGADLAQELFAQGSPVGQSLVIGDWPFVVVGVLEWVGDPTAGIPAQSDGALYVPFGAVASAFRGNRYAQTLRLRLRSPDLADAAVAETKRVLDRERKQRGETSGEFQVTNTIDRIGQLAMVLTTVKLVVGLVGGIGLFVGAVGVANVLLVSVRERRSEIGVRRAIGATRRAVFAGFLIEALAMTLTGGAVGIAGAWALTKIASFFPQIPAGARPHISLATALTAVILLTVVGLVAGVGPARRAAGVPPAEALRAD